MTNDRGAIINAGGGERIRIVRIIDRLNIGGPAKHVTWLTAGLNQAEFETVLIAGTVAEGEGDMSYFANAAGITPRFIAALSRELSWRDALVVGRLIGELFRLRPQIVHTHKAKAGAVGRLAVLLYRWLTPSALWLRPRSCRVVHTYHGHIFHSYYGAAKSRLFIAIERLLARLATDRIVTISAQQRREIGERFGVGRGQQLRVIPLGIDLAETSTAPGQLRREFGLAADELLVGIVGRLCEVKNQALLLEAAARLLAEKDAALRVRFVIIGDGHLREDLERLAQRLGLADRVLFTGFRQDAVAFYPDLDVVALTSLNEGTPLTLIEAMNSGCALAVTEVGGVVDLMGAHQEMRDGFKVWEHGVTVASRDAAGLARALHYLLERAELRGAMGAQGRAFVRARLSRERLVQEIEELYRELLGGGANRVPGIGTRAWADPCEFPEGKQIYSSKR